MEKGVIPGHPVTPAAKNSVTNLTHFSSLREEGLGIRGRNDGRLGQKGFCGRSHRVQSWAGGSGIFREGWAGMCPHLPVR